MKKKLIAVSAISALSLAVSAQAVSAGEYSRGNGGTAATGKGASLCLFNGADQPDESYLGAGDGEPLFWDDLNENGVVDDGEVFGDDADWATTPAGGRVQSYGQIVAAGGKGFVPSPGVACNPNSGFEE
jgi:opacity protein-like surface antigen